MIQLQTNNPGTSQYILDLSVEAIWFDQQKLQYSIQKSIRCQVRMDAKRTHPKIPPAHVAHVSLSRQPAVVCCFFGLQLFSLSWYTAAAAHGTLLRRLDRKKPKMSCGAQIRIKKKPVSTKKLQQGQCIPSCPRCPCYCMHRSDKNLSQSSNLQVFAMPGGWQTINDLQDTNILWHNSSVAIFARKSWKIYSRYIYWYIISIPFHQDFAF